MVEKMCHVFASQVAQQPWLGIMEVPAIEYLKGSGSGVSKLGCCHVPGGDKFDGLSDVNGRPRGSRDGIRLQVLLYQPSRVLPGAPEEVHSTGRTSPSPENSV